MKVGIIGAGAIGSAIAKQLVKINVDVVLSNSRGPESLTDLVKSLGPRAHAGTVLEAAQNDIVIISVPWKSLSEALENLPDFNGRIVIDTTNPVGPDFNKIDLGGKTSSEIVKEMVPGARLVKVMNTLEAKVLREDPKQFGGQRVLFMSGDDKEAKETISALLDTVGFSVVDLGDLQHGGMLQEFPGGPLPILNLISMQP